MILLEVHDGLFADPFQVTPVEHSGWHFITPCDREPLRRLPQGGITFDDVATVCPLFYEAGEFSVANQKHFQSLLFKLLAAAKSEHDLNSRLGKLVHDAGDVTVQRASGKFEKWTITQYGIIKTLLRIHCLPQTGGRRLALLTHAFEKPANSKNTPAKEQARFADIVARYYAATDSGKALLIKDQGGENGFKRLFP
ncbi:hypothetical protein [Paracidovorax avenae]|uniref:hypothetical protein n=1 Tax=Paracidovorax avenae TaxID=80867 RepID=UPI001AD82E27|nr:hypothetical protein [Paracidovorax avenae]